MRLFSTTTQRREPAEDPNGRPIATRSGYLTDGASLFRVLGTLLGVDDEAFLEMEDCCTLELLLIRRADATELGLRGVTPAGPGELTPVGR